MSRFGIVNVRMVITEEKILLNIEKVQKMINPKSKKQIIQLDDDAYFKDLIESIKTYLMEYPKKKNFPSSVYKAAFGLVEFATNQFEENTKKIEELIKQREENISSAGELKETLEIVEQKEEGWEEKLNEAKAKFSDDINETLDIISKAEDKEAEDYKDAMKLLNARINNLESNLHIEIDMERIEDRSKALSYIGIEVADALKTIPTPIEVLSGDADAIMEAPEEVVEVNNKKIENVQSVAIVEDDEPAKVETPVQTQVAVQEPVQQIAEQPITQEQQQYTEATTFEAKPSLWQRIKNSKLGKAISYIIKVRIVVQTPALPEGKENNGI